MPKTEQPVATFAADPKALLPFKISELDLRIAGTRLEALIQQLYDELDARGIRFKPKCYLADEWGCPTDVPIIGIPFYLADPVLCQLECDMTGVEAETEDEVMMYLRHEAGHAFNYAYRLFRQLDWRRLFGSYHKPYHDEFRAEPFSTRYVRHVPGWYGQKHPDEDFAETFAVWLKPHSNWRERYKGTRALEKLLLVERLAREFGPQPPLVESGRKDAPVEELDVTLADWYEIPADDRRACSLPLILNEDLQAVFPAEEGQPAIEVLRSHRIQLLRDLHAWTGADRHLLASLLQQLMARVQGLGLKIEAGQAESRLLALAIFVTTLVMNYNYTDEFVTD